MTNALYPVVDSELSELMTEEIESNAQINAPRSRPYAKAFVALSVMVALIGGSFVLGSRISPQAEVRSFTLEKAIVLDDAPAMNWEPAWYNMSEALPGVDMSPQALTAPQDGSPAACTCPYQQCPGAKKNKSRLG
jgi:hypothetical protein